jgi:imidazole glycerol-phosphate synthase subunit HisH
MKIAIVNYGMGNLGSVRRAFEDIGAEVYIANHPAAIYDANKIVLPGVGAFTEGMECLTNAGWASALHEVVIQQGKPLLGICLGMQMLATMGQEGGETNGLDFIPGKVQRLDTIGCKLRIPHVGWNDVRYCKQDVLFNRIPDLSDFYFVHSYAFVPENQEHLIATASYDCDLAAAIRNGNVFGCQFHPEKSSKAGRQLLKNFMDYVPC